MADKLSLNNCVLLKDETIQMLKEMKLKEFERKKLEIEQCLENYQTSITKIQDYMDWQNGCLNKILIQFNSEIENLQTELQSMTEPVIEDLQESDLKVLQQILNEQQLKNKQQTSDINKVRTKEFFIQIEKQLQVLKQEDKISQIFDYLNEVINEKEPEQEIIIQRIENQQDSTKTPFLKHICNKHKKEIIMFTLDENCLGERILCIDCIEKFQQGSFITLENANKQWLAHQGELYDYQNKFQCEREQKQSEIQKIILSYKQKQNQLQEEIIQLIQTQNKEIESQIQDLQKNIQNQLLMQLELKDLKAAINQLSQKDKLHQIQQQQMKMIISDQKNQKEILKKISDIELLLKDCKMELAKYFDDNNSSFIHSRNQITI